MEAWIWVTIAAAAVQTLRFALQRRLAGTGLSAAGATYARFVCAAPLALAGLGGLMAWRADPLPALPPAFWAWITMGALAQILATQATVALFSRRSFAVGIAFTKTEVVLVAALSAWLLSEPVGAAALLAIAIGTAGVVLLARPADGWRAGGTDRRALLLGLGAGALFGLSAIGYRGATVQVGHPMALFRALTALAAATVIQTGVMTATLALVQPGQLTRVARRWRAVWPVGVAGMLGSLGWFTAFALQNAALVRSLGQIELLFGILVSALVFGERLRRVELVGMALLAASVVLIVLQG